MTMLKFNSNNSYRGFGVLGFWGFGASLGVYAIYALDIPFEESILGRLSETPADQDK